MNTRERAAAIASAAAGFRAFLGEVTAEALIELVRCELGHPEVLDDFQPYGSHQARAVAAPIILHILSGNTPHAGLQSLVRGLLLGSHNLCKLPSSGLPELERFCNALPPYLAAQIEVSRILQPGWLGRADALIVFGDDETIAHFRRLARDSQTFLGHGHKVGLGIVFDDPAGESAALAAQDVSLFDQQGCVSPHLFYVNETGGLTARAYAARLADEMERFNRSHPRRPLAPEESAAIAARRSETEFRAAAGEAVALWKSQESTDWTVIFEADPAFTPSPLNRLVFVKPLPDDLPAAVSSARRFLGSIGIWPATLDHARAVADLGASRLCAIGRMQEPPLTWHQDAEPQLARLVRWVDFQP